MATIGGEIAEAVRAGVSIRTSALQFLRWAYDNGLLSPDAYYPGDSVGTPNFGDNTVKPAALGILRSRQIRFVTVDTTANRISVFLRKASPTVKELKSLPPYCNGIPLQYLQGNTETVSPANLAEVSSNCAQHVIGANNYYTCGSSISVGNNRAAGTLGCLVRDAAGTIYGLSNNHVSGACSYAPTGLPILAPGVLDISPNITDCP